jgi:hypothetical protein
MVLGGGEPGGDDGERGEGQQEPRPLGGGAQPQALDDAAGDGRDLHGGEATPGET